jgi:hypothetical protein
MGAELRIQRPHLASERRRWTRKTRRKPILEALSGTGKWLYESRRTRQSYGCESFACFNQFPGKIEPAAVEMHVAFDRPVVNSFPLLFLIDSDFGEEIPERVRKRLCSGRDEITATGAAAPFRVALLNLGVRRDGRFSVKANQLIANAKLGHFLILTAESRSGFGLANDRRLTTNDGFLTRWPLPGCPAAGSIACP